MRRDYIFIWISLLIGLFVYLFYRTDKTLVNQILIRVISLDTYRALKANIARALPLNDVIIYSLPEGLWVFCITLTSKPFYIRLNKRRFNCVFIPLIFCVGLELLQLFHITRGRFDFMDIGISVIFWILGNYVLRNKYEKKDIFTRPNSKTIIFLTSYAIVYLAHVFK